MNLLDIMGMQCTDGLSMCSKPDHAQDARALRPTLAQQSYSGQMRKFQMSVQS